MKEMTSGSQTNLTSFYKSLPKPVAPKTEFVERVAERCEVDIQTVRNWVSGMNKPSNDEYIKILVEETGIEAGKLFELKANE